MFNIVIDENNKIISSGYCDFTKDLKAGQTQVELPEGTVIPDILVSDVTYNIKDKTFKSVTK